MTLAEWSGSEIAYVCFGKSAYRYQTNAWNLYDKIYQYVLGQKSYIINIIARWKVNFGT